MRRSVFGLGLCLLACGDDGSQRAGGSLAVDVDQAGGPTWLAGDAGADLTVADLECLHGGKVGKIEVVFDCFEITTVSCKDLSNVVIELADGTRKRFEGLSGQRGVFRADDVITRVWVKAGSNHSGDGPGYGELFEGGEQVCPPAPPPAPPADAGAPPADAGCFVADGICDYVPKPPTPATDGPIGY
jgi:hypothetical protein